MRLYFLIMLKTDQLADDFGRLAIMPKMSREAKRLNVNNHQQT